MAIQKKAGISASAFNVSIVIPCYNEEGRIDALLKGLEQFIQQNKFQYEIILVDDGSTDKTVEKIESSALYKQLSDKNQIRLIKQAKNGGKGRALKAGVAAAAKDYILTMDADLSTSPIELNRFLNDVSPNRILIASREHKESKITAEASRKTVGRVFNFLVRILTPLPQRDTQCGFKLYPAAVAKNLFAKTKINGWAHDVEILYQAHLNGVEIKEMPVTWVSMDGSKINVMRDSLKMFFELLLLSLRIRFNWFFIQPFKVRETGNKNDSIFRGFFAIGAVVLFFLMASMSFHFGITGDDLDQKIYGEKVLNFYTSFGKDTSCLHLEVGNKKNLYIYGGLFNMISAAANRYIGGLDEYDMRHLINAIAGFLAILFTGLLARSLGNWMTGFIALLVLSLWPQFFGQSMNNPKDIPFALGYVMSIYYITRLVKELPRPSLYTWVMTTIAIAFAINIRIGGLLLIGMLFAFIIGAYILSPEIRRKIASTNSTSYLAKWLAIVTVMSYFGGILFWPYGITNPLFHPYAGLKELTHFSFPIGLLFDGKLMQSTDIPWYYIPKWFWITTPLVVLFPALAFAGIWFFAKKKFSATLSLLIIFATIFPWAYAVYSKSPMYDGLRQMLFIAPMIAMCAALTWHYLISISDNKIAKGVVIFLMVAGLALPLRFSIANHPNEYCYFNELIGGIKGAYGKYDTDYYMNSIRKTSDKFKESEMFKNAGNGKKILLATNAVDPVNWYFRKDTAKVKIVYTKWDEQGNPKTRGARDWDYGIYYSRDIDPSMLFAGTWPSDKAIYKNEADGVTLSCIIERKDKSDLLGYRAMKKDSLLPAEKYLTDALSYNPQNEEAALNMLQVKLGLRKYDDAIKYANLLVELYPSNEIKREMYGLLSKLYQQKGDMQNAQQYQSLAAQFQPPQSQGQ